MQEVMPSLLSGCLALSSRRHAFVFVLQKKKNCWGGLTVCLNSRELYVNGEYLDFPLVCFTSRPFNRDKEVADLPLKWRGTVKLRFVLRRNQVLCLCCIDRSSSGSLVFRFI